MQEFHHQHKIASRAGFVKLDQVVNGGQKWTGWGPARNPKAQLFRKISHNWNRHSLTNYLPICNGSTNVLAFQTTNKINSKCIGKLVQEFGGTQWKQLLYDPVPRSGSSFHFVFVFKVPLEVEILKASASIKILRHIFLGTFFANIDYDKFSPSIREYCSDDGSVDAVL